MIRNDLHNHRLFKRDTRQDKNLDRDNLSSGIIASDYYEHHFPSRFSFRELIREDVSLQRKKLPRVPPPRYVSVGTGFLYARRFTTAVPPLFSKPILLSFYTFVCSSLVDYYTRGIRYYVDVSFRARENAFVI